MTRKALLFILPAFLLAGRASYADERYYCPNTVCYEFRELPDTPAPKGYEPVYISHYGRHGSRTGIDCADIYDRVVGVLKDAHRQNLLTASGDSLLNECIWVRDAYNGMDGALTRVGEAEEHRLAEIMYDRYSPVFTKGSGYVRVQTSIVPRSIVSGECFVQTLASRQGNLRFTFDTGEKYYRFINNKAPKYVASRVDEIRDSINALKPIDGLEFCERIFKDPRKGLEMIAPADSFQFLVWNVARQSRACGVETDMFRHLPEAVNLKWRDNAIRKIVLGHSNSVEFGDARMKRVAPLVETMLTQARQAIECGNAAADLKFGHDYPLVALAGYFGLDGVGGRYSLDQLPDAWNDPMNIPFASNMMMVFYRHKRTGDVLVKFIYNGEEKTVRDLTPVMGPYYRWTEVYRHFLPSGDEQVFALADWHWHTLPNGAEAGYAQLPLFGSVQSISVLRYPMRKVGTFIADDCAAEADSTSALVLRHGGVAGVNASYFNVKTLYPTTFVKDDGVQEGWTRQSELFRVDGLLAMRKHGKDVRIFKCDTLTCTFLAKRFPEAIAGGPVLLLGGEEARPSWPYASFYYKRHPRTFVGTTDGGMVYLVVIDGRFPGQGIGTTIPETVRIAKMFGLKDAINLDGGGSSTLWTVDDGVVNHPYDNKCFDHQGQRVVPNVVYIK